MKPDNKISIQEVHAQLEKRAGYCIPTRHITNLLHGWRVRNKLTDAGKDGWLSPDEAISFLQYAY